MPIARDGSFIGSVPLAFDRLAEYIETRDLARLIASIQVDLENEQHFHPNDVVYAAVNMMSLLERHTQYDFQKVARGASRGQEIERIRIGLRIAELVKIAVGKDQKKLLATIDETPIEDHGPMVFACVSLLQTYQREKGRDLAAAARAIRAAMKGVEGARALDLRPEKYLA